LRMMEECYPPHFGRDLLENLQPFPTQLRFEIVEARNVFRPDAPSSERSRGVRRTTVTLLAQSLQVRRLIRYRRGRIVLLDRKGLEECACECYDVMRDEKLGPALGVHF
jgi:hypothetical protein